jgi:hypothetical protein
LWEILRFLSADHCIACLHATQKWWQRTCPGQNSYNYIHFIFRYLISRGYGHPQDKDSGGSDDDMSDEGADDMLPSTSRTGLDTSGHRLEFLIGDHVLPYDMTVYQAAQQFGSAPMFDIAAESGIPDPENRNSPVVMYGSPGIWARIHTVYYRPIATTAVATTNAEGTSASTSCIQGKIWLLFKAEQLCQIREGFENCPRNYFGPC